MFHKIMLEARGLKISFFKQLIEEKTFLSLSHGQKL